MQIRNVEDAIKLTNSKANGRTRYVGQEPFADELLVAEIERLRKLLETPEPEPVVNFGDAAIEVVRAAAAASMLCDDAGEERPAGSLGAVACERYRRANERFWHLACQQG
jgi:hypothetical protein